MIDLAEDRDRFKTLLEKLNLRSRPNGIATSSAEKLAVAEPHRLSGRHPPVLCARRPRRWRSCTTPSARRYMKEAWSTRLRQEARC
jgi:hypothetical protein